MIGFYDSGLGGALVLRTALELGLTGEVIFLADLAHSPYGVKTTAEIRRLARTQVRYLAERGCKTIVVACNTATAAAITALRQEFPEVRLIGTEPAVRPAITAAGGRKVLVLATTATIQGAKLRSLVGELDAATQVGLMAADRLVQLAEMTNAAARTEEMRQYLHQLLAGRHWEQYGSVVLGCTHFPAAREILAEIVGPEVALVDGAEGVARQVLAVAKGEDGGQVSATGKSEDDSQALDRVPTLDEPAQVEVVMTAERASFVRRVREVLGERASLRFRVVTQK